MIVVDKIILVTFSSLVLVLFKHHLRAANCLIFTLSHVFAAAELFEHFNLCGWVPGALLAAVIIWLGGFRILTLSDSNQIDCNNFCGNCTFYRNSLVISENVCTHKYSSKILVE